MDGLFSAARVARQNPFADLPHIGLVSAQAQRPVSAADGTAKVAGSKLGSHAWYPG